VDDVTIFVTRPADFDIIQRVLHTWRQA
jgi:hypothetical protein